MKLKRMWTSVCIFIMFIIFNVIMIVSSGFFSGLFPSDNLIPYTCAVTICGVLVMGLFTFLFGKAADAVYADEMAKTVAAKSIYAIAVTATVIGGAFYRIDILQNTTASPAGRLSLYENAMVGASISYEYDFLSLIYSKLLNLVLMLSGNFIIFAYFFQIVLFMLFVLLSSEAVRLLLGKLASLVFAIYVSFMPLFSDAVRNAIISTDELFYCMYGLEFLIIAWYLKLDSRHKYESKWYILWFVLVGFSIGFMTYMDAGTLVVILPLLLAGLFIIGNDIVLELFRLVIILISGLACFFAMILQEGGPENFDAVIVQWANYFFKNINTFSTFWTYTNYKPVYLVTFIAMSGILVGFWKNRIFERVTPFLLSTMLVFFATPFFGATKMNSQIMLTIYFAMVLACVASLIVTNKNEGVALASENKETVSDSEEESSSEETIASEATDDQDTEKETNTSIAEVVKPETTPQSKETETEEIETADESPVADTEPEKMVDTKDINSTNDAFNNYAGHYVPEGMVLPAGSEDEMDVSVSKMKMPKFEGTIALDRKSRPIEKNKKKNAVESSKKDDFDIAFTPGDDFDI